MTVDTEGLANIANFVGKRHLHGMKAVAGVLEHLSYPYFSSVQRRPDVLIECRYSVSAGRIQLSYQGEWRIEKVFDGRPLSHEFRIHAHAEVDAGFLS